jgi:GWxTD domain-containing protein
MMRVLVVLCALSIVAAGCGSGSGVVADCYSIARYKKILQPSFDLYVMNVRAGTGTRVDIYTQTQFERLRFLKSDLGYSAAYTILFVIKGDGDEIIQSREVSRTVNVRTYEESISLDADAFLQSFTLAPGSYVLECTSTDQNSLVRYANRNRLNVQEFVAGSASASTILLLLKPRSVEKGLVLRPLFPQTLWYARDSIGIFRELYNIRRGDAISAVVKYLTHPAAAGGRSAHSDVTMSPPYVTTTAPCPRVLDAVVYADSFTFRADSEGTVPFVRYYPVPPSGYSKLEMALRISHGGADDSVFTVMKFFRRKSIHADLEDIVDAMRYIVRDSELDAIRKPAAEANRTQAIEQFWADRGGAVRRAEFEGRVDEANRLFSICTEGSRTPMGVTFIVCGPPDAVECRSPYSETWFYTVDSQTMAVPFRLDSRNDETLFYELPAFSVNDQLWRTFVDRWRMR